MERTAILNRYRVAMVLVPDEVVAGDLFMRARSEAELRRLAGRWREQQGLGPMPEPLELPVLDAFQEEQALHLHRRSLARRRVVWGLGTSLMALLVVGLFAWRWQVTWLPPGYAGRSVQTITATDGLALNLYRAEAGYGQVTVWWELRGPRAEEISVSLAPSLEVVGIDLPLQQQTELRVVSRSRVFGRSIYQVFITTDETVELHGAVPVPFSVRLPLERTSTEAVVPLGIRVETIGLELGELVLRPDSTRLRYRADAPPGGKAAELGGLSAGSSLLEPVGTPTAVDESGLMEVRYDAIPHGVTRLSVALTPAVQLAGPLAYDLPAPRVLSDFTRYGDRIQAIYRPEEHHSPRFEPGKMPYFVDRQGRRYEVLEIPPQGWDGGVGYSLVVENPPPDVEFVLLVIPEVWETSYSRRITVDLARGHPLRPPGLINGR